MGLSPALPCMPRSAICTTIFQGIQSFSLIQTGNGTATSPSGFQNGSTFTLRLPSSFEESSNGEKKIKKYSGPRQIHRKAQKQTCMSLCRKSTPGAWVSWTKKAKARGTPSWEPVRHPDLPRLLFRRFTIASATKHLRQGSQDRAYAISLICWRTGIVWPRQLLSTWRCPQVGVHPPRPSRREAACK